MKSAPQASNETENSAQTEATPAKFEKEEGVRPRTIVTTDLECDDICALIHMPAEINDHTIGEVHQEEGNNLTEWRPMDLEYLPKLISEDYAEVYPSLSTNDERYPNPEELPDSRRPARRREQHVRQLGRPHGRQGRHPRV